MGDTKYAKLGEDYYFWQEKSVPVESPYLSFIDEQSAPFSLKSEYGKKSWNGILEYSTDALTWSVWDGTQIGSSNDGKLYLRGTGNTYITGNASVSKNFVLTNGRRIQCRGNIETLLDYATVAAGNHPTMDNYCYACIFKNCKSLTTGPSLPATQLVDYCYYKMFDTCTSLKEAPELPAIELAKSCYTEIFYRCNSLTGVIHCPVSTSSSPYKLKKNDLPENTVAVVYDL